MYKKLQTLINYFTDTNTSQGANENNFDTGTGTRGWS